MSLINDMLRGLEQRRAGADDVSLDPVLGELSAVDYEELTRRSRRASTGLRLALLLALLAAGYYLAGDLFRAGSAGNRAGAAQVEAARDGAGAASPSAGAGNEAATPDVRHQAAPGGDAGFALKLDAAIPGGTAAAAADAAVSVREVRVARSDGGLMLELNLPARTRYLMYTLKDPYRMVLELSHAKYNGSLPDISRMEGVSAIRQRVEKDGTYRLVLQSEREIRIDDSGLQDIDGGYLLRVDMAYAAGAERAPAVAGSEQDAGGTPTGNFSKSPASGGGADRQTAAKSSSRIDVMIYQGRKLYEEGEVRNGLEKLIEAVKLEPGHTRARTTLAMLLLKQHKEAAARKILAEGLGLRPDNSEWAKVLARILYNDGRLEQAQTILEEAAPPISGNLDYHALYAGVLQARGEHTRAAIVYRNLLKYGGSNGAWWLGLAISLEAMSRNTDAAVAYRNALNTPDLKPDSAAFIKDRLQNLKQQS